MYPLNLVSGICFQSLMKLLEPRYIVPYRKTFTRTHIPGAHNEMKAQVKSELQESTRICLTTDSWTDDYKHCSYMRVTAHFINDLRLEIQIVLSFYKLFTVPQTSSNLAEALLDVIQEWELKDKKFVVVSDGGANMQVTCCKYGFLNVSALTTIIKKCSAIIYLFHFHRQAIISKQKELAKFYGKIIEADDHDNSEPVTTDDIPQTSLKKQQAPPMEFHIDRHRICGG